MSYCINPICPQPNDPANTHNRICRNCGSELFLQGHYQVMRLVSDTSGFGKVYEAYEGAIPKILKVLKESHTRNSKIIELFQQEAIVLSQLHHPGIPQVDANGYFKFFPRNYPEPVHCIVMEKIEGLTLRQWMRQQGSYPISEQQALNWLKQLAEILHLVHQKNYFHRDIKPENIMIRPSGQLVLIDFGTARELTYTYLADVGGSGSVTKISSAGYTPPEQEKGHAVPQSDFYALGRTFVYLLTGKSATDPALYDPLTDKLNWQNSAPHISPQLAAFIDHLMAPTAAARPKNTKEILDHLADISRQLSQPQEETNLNGHLRGSTTYKQDVTQLSAKSTIPLNKRLTPLSRWLVGGVAAVAVGVGGYGSWQLAQNYLSPNVVLVNTITGISSYVNYLIISPDGKQLLIGSADHKIRLWNLNPGKESRTIVNYSIPINYFAISPDWKTIVTGGANDTIKVWNFTTGKEASTLTGHLSAVNYVAVSNDGKKIASASADKTIKIWDFITSKEIYTLTGHSSFVNHIIISNDDKRLVSASADHTIKIWNLTTGKEITTLQGHLGFVNYLVISPDGKLLVSASADQTIKIWDFLTGKEIRTLKGHDSSVKPLAISPDGKLLASGSADGTIKIWNFAAGTEIRSFKGHDSSVNSLVISPDGKVLVSASADSTIKIWQMPRLGE